MAILAQAGNQVEVKVVRRPENTPFDELVKSGERDKPEALTSFRYIAGESNQAFGLEIRLKKGYVFGAAVGVLARLCLSSDPLNRLGFAYISRPEDHEGGIKQDISVVIETSSTIVGSKFYSGGRFVLSDLQVVEKKLKNATNVSGIKPENVGCFYVEVHRVIKMGEITEAEGAARFKGDQQACIVRQPCWDIKKIDRDNLQVQGVTFAISVAGGDTEMPMPLRPTFKNDPSRALKFVFICRQADFLQRMNIVKYPLPIRYYAWTLLTEEEQETVLKELQEINKGFVRPVLLAKSAQQQSNPNEMAVKDAPKEWRAWSMMSLIERQATFETLQKDNQRREVIRQCYSREGHIVSLDEDNTNGGLQHTTPMAQNLNIEPTASISPPSAKSSTKKRPRAEANHEAPKAPVFEAAATNNHDSLMTNLTKESPNVQGPDLAPDLSQRELGTADDLAGLNIEDANNCQDMSAKKEEENSDRDLGSPPVTPPAKRFKGRHAPDATKAEIDDEELEKMEAEQRNLEKEIEEAERLAEMKRKRDALQAKIDAVKALKG